MASLSRLVPSKITETFQFPSLLCEQRELNSTWFTIQPVNILNPLTDPEGHLVC